MRVRLRKMKKLNKGFAISKTSFLASTESAYSNKEIP
jgi:hypothetical protein